jgi:hypothetical protein
MYRRVRRGLRHPEAPMFCSPHPMAHPPVIISLSYVATGHVNIRMRIRRTPRKSEPPSVVPEMKTEMETCSRLVAPFIGTRLDTLRDTSVPRPDKPKTARTGHIASDCYIIYMCALHLYSLHMEPFTSCCLAPDILVYLSPFIRAP